MSLADSGPASDLPGALSRNSHLHTALSISPLCILDSVRVTGMYRPRPENSKTKFVSYEKRLLFHFPADRAAQARGSDQPPVILYVQ
jgi:hypothetical protein